MWPEKVQAERYQRQRGLWRQGSFCLSEGDVSKGFSWAKDGNSWAKYEGIVLECPDPCTFSVRFRSVSATNSTFGPQSNATAVRVALAIEAPLLEHEVAVLPAAQSDDWQTLNATVKGSLKHEAGATVFLRLSGQCEVDYFFFTSGGQ